MELNNLPAGEELTSFLADQSDEDLNDLTESLKAAMLETFGDGKNLSGEDVEKLETYKAQLDAAQSTITQRADDKAELSSKAASIMDGVVDPDPEDEDGDTDDAGTDTDNDSGDGADALETEDGKALVASVSKFLDTVADKVVMSEGAGGRDLNRHIRLADIARHAPDAKVPVSRTEPVIIASAEINGFTQGGRINGYAELARAVHNRAKSMSVEKAGRAASRKIVASLQREYTYTIGRQPSAEEISEILRLATDVEALVASGGWCRPSEFSTDFFNVVAEAGMLDLPSVGTAESGGIQMPTSPSFGDVIDSPGLWTWTETNDIDALSSDSIIKPCVRVPCPDFLDVRLACDGLCVTAGNLQDWSWPQSIQNFLRLLMAARAHLTNANIIQILIDGGTEPDDIGPSIPVDHTGLIGNAASALLQSIELSAIDYRTKYRMNPDAILEVVLPQWIVGPFKADLANRTGVENFLAISNAQVANWLNSKNVRAQFVQDWQTDLAGEIGGPDPATTWPDTADYLIYAPGTFVRANGLQLDLGVVRDSVLNETNDHTAAWMEDCYLIHKPGHESRVVTVDLCTAGMTGEASLDCAG
jgi:hypothetical protein